MQYCRIFGILLIVYIGWADGQMLGPAEVRITNVEQCPDAEKYLYSLEVNRRKLNRTHEAYSGGAGFDIWVDHNVGFYAAISKFVDGGYKPNAYELKDADACEFFMKSFKNSFTEILRLAGIEEKCPIAPGFYTVTDFVVDYDTMPESLLYGDFRIDSYAVINETQERVFCIRIYVTSKPKDSKPGFG